MNSSLSTRHASSRVLRSFGTSELRDSRSAIYNVSPRTITFFPGCRRSRSLLGVQVVGHRIDHRGLRVVVFQLSAKDLAGQDGGKCAGLALERDNGLLALGFDQALYGYGDLGRIGLGAGTGVGDDMGRFHTGVVASLGGVRTGDAQLGLMSGPGLVSALPSLFRFGDVALNFGGALVEDRIEFQHEELAEKYRNDGKNGR